MLERTPVVVSNLGHEHRAYGHYIGGTIARDVYPDRMSSNNGFDIFPFPPASPFGYNGRFVYTRLEVDFGR